MEDAFGDAEALCVEYDVEAIGELEWTTAGGGEHCGGGVLGGRRKRSGPCPDLRGAFLEFGQDAVLLETAVAVGWFFAGCEDAVGGVGGLPGLYR